MWEDQELTRGPKMIIDKWNSNFNFDLKLNES